MKQVNCRSSHSLDEHDTAALCDSGEKAIEDSERHESIEGRRTSTASRSPQSDMIACQLHCNHLFDVG